MGLRWSGALWSQDGVTLGARILLGDKQPTYGNVRATNPVAGTIKTGITNNSSSVLTDIVLWWR